MAENQGNFKLITSATELDHEFIKLSKHGIHGKFAMYTGKQGDHIVTIVPSLNVSGYGRTEQEAEESIEENLQIFFVDLFEISEVDRHKELKRLGWITNIYFKGQLSSTYVDENGLLQNFDNPDQVKKRTLQAA